MSPAAALLHPPPHYGTGHLEAAVRATREVYRDNPGLALAVPIFDLLVRAQLETSADADSLHPMVLEELRSFEAQAIACGLSHNHTRLILYALAATADDCILHTAWGKESNWSSKTLISALFQETWGGERFYTLLSQMMAAPHAVTREIEFYYFCMEFGFEGKYRLAAIGSSELTRIKSDIYQFLRSVKGSIKPEMSPTWRGLSAEGRGPRDLRLYALGAAGLIFCLFLLFVGLYLILHREAVIAVVQVKELMADPLVPKPHPEVVLPLHPEVAPAPPPQAAAPAPAPAPPPVPKETPLQGITSFLEPEQKQGLVAVIGRDGNVVIRTTMELFATASTALRPPYPDVMKKIAAALVKYPGPVVVLGYSDNVPINTMTYPNNQALSAARAQAVAAILGVALGDAGRVTSQGMGDSDPIGDNATAEGRQKNRRVEIVLTPK
ncbi:type IVB secretion system protein IcmH/DotU [Aquabacter sp. CN5-332]|uniref:type IVB secretion system protein IcmH/DotU n=1 Tax=Aquabacter sp. CN5-332 TaxID=3156608 RepID=UPI0032B516F4